MDSYFIPRYTITKYGQVRFRVKSANYYESYGPFFNFIFCKIPACGWGWPWAGASVSYWHIFSFTLIWNFADSQDMIWTCAWEFCLNDHTFFSKFSIQPFCKMILFVFLSFWGANLANDRLDILQMILKLCTRFWYYHQILFKPFRDFRLSFFPFFFFSFCLRIFMLLSLCSD